MSAFSVGDLAVLRAFDVDGESILAHVLVFWSDAERLVVGGPECGNLRGAVAVGGIKKSIYVLTVSPAALKPWESHSRVGAPNMEPGE
eukprot:11724581-Karenia_brevis.AAC.1